MNYCVANSAVLVPESEDPNRAAAQAILQRLHPHRRVIGIDVRKLCRGGLLHRVTQRPAALGAERDRAVRWEGRRSRERKAGFSARPLRRHGRRLPVMAGPGAGPNAGWGAGSSRRRKAAR